MRSSGLNPIVTYGFWIHRTNTSDVQRRPGATYVNWNSNKSNTDPYKSSHGEDIKVLAHKEKITFMKKE